MSVGLVHTCALRDDGAIECWGGNESGALSAPAGKFRHLVAGRAFACAVRVDDRVLCWGNDDYGQAPRPVVGPASLPDGVVGRLYRQVLSLTAGDYVPVLPEFLAVAGGVPGLGLNAAGVLGGVPASPGTHAVTAEGSDANGFVAERSYAVTIIGDTTPPVITATVGGAAGNAGWYTGDVSVTWSVVDPESAVTVQIGCGAKTVKADTGGTIFTCQATSSGGTATKSVTVKRDATKPALAPSVAPNPVTLGGAATATAGASDAASGLAAASCAPVVTGSVGSFTVACTATDKAGNVATGSAAYSVTAPSGTSIRFLAPRPGATYDVGSAFRARFRIVDAAGKPIPDAAAKALVAACRVRAGLDEARACARYKPGKDLFRLKINVRRGTSVGPHEVVAQLRAADGTVVDTARAAFTVR